MGSMSEYRYVYVVSEGVLGEHGVPVRALGSWPKVEEFCKTTYRQKPQPDRDEQGKIKTDAWHLYPNADGGPSAVRITRVGFGRVRSSK